MANRLYIPQPRNIGRSDVFKIARLIASLLAIELAHGIDPSFYIWKTPNPSSEPLPYWWPDVQMAYVILLVGLIGAANISAITRTHKNGDNDLVVNLEWRHLSIHIAGAVSVGLILLQIMGTSLVYSRRFVYEPYTGPGLWFGAVVGLLSLLEATEDISPGPKAKSNPPKQIKSSKNGEPTMLY